MRRAAAVVLSLLAIVLVRTENARAQQNGCARVVIFTLPAVTWEMVQQHQPPSLLRIMEEGAAGQMSVRTNSSRTSYASGFVTIGAGTRTDGGWTAGGSIDTGNGTFAGGYPEIVEGAQDAAYVAEPGALGDALAGEIAAIGNGDAGISPPTPLGLERYTLLAAMGTDGVVTTSSVGDELLVADPSAPFGARSDPTALEEAVDAVLQDGCSSMVVDQGDLIRADMAGLYLADPTPAIMEEALLAADDLLGFIDSRLGPDDLLLVVSPTSPWWDDDVHLGVAVAKGEGFPPGHTLRSASTRQTSFVTLPDVAPTALEHLEIERPPSMLGRPFVAVSTDEDLLPELVMLDRESVFAHGTQAGISTTFVIVQIAVYALALYLLARRGDTLSREKRSAWAAWLRRAGLGIAAFPLATYLITPLPAHRLGVPLFVGVLIATTVAIVAVISRYLRDPLDRLLAITAATVALFVVDLTLLKALQLNAVWGNDPIVAGRFTGLGNIAFSILGACTILTAALLVHRFPGRRWVFPVVAVLFLVTVVIDGAPAFGSDVGGVLALVPALGITYVLLLGKRPSLAILGIAGVCTLVALGGFLALDFARPPEDRTHLARLVESVQERGPDAFVEAVGRKIDTNLRVFRSTIWTYLVPPALAVVAWLLLRPRGRWRQLAVEYPKLRAGLIGGLLLGVIGFAVNDSGIVIPAMILSFLAPMALLLHLVMERERWSGSG